MTTESNAHSSQQFSLSDIISCIAGLCDEWDKTEKWIKDGEFVVGDTIIPSINEMRYAGRQLVDACRMAQNSHSEKARNHVLEAGANLTKARHDVVDTCISYICNTMEDEAIRLGAGNILKHFPDYGKILTLLDDIGNKISESRENRKQRDEIYNDIMENDMLEVFSAYRSFRKSLPLVEENIEKEERKNRHLWIFGVTGIIIGVVGITIGILGFVS